MPAISFRSVKLHSQEIEQYFSGNRLDGSWIQRRATANFSGAVAQFKSGIKIRIAPRGGFRQIAELFIRVGSEIACLLVGRVGKHKLVCDLCHETILAVFEILACAPEDGLRAAHIGYVLF